MKRKMKMTGETAKAEKTLHESFLTIFRDLGTDVHEP
jgi:hypothetical protein